MHLMDKEERVNRGLIHKLRKKNLFFLENLLLNHFLVFLCKPSVASFLKKKQKVEESKEQETNLFKKEPNYVGQCKEKC
jgi:hypothetical protein